MSAHRILGCTRSQGSGCSPVKAVRELGSDRRETGRSLSAVGVRDLRGSAPSTRGRGGQTSDVPVVVPTALLGSHVWQR